MQTRSTDVAILGAGTAGLNARREAEKAGKDWVLVDPGPYGTTCARVGCMPSKLLIAAGDAAHHARHASTFGVRTEVAVDGRAVMDRVRRERDRFAGFVARDLEDLGPDRLLRARGRFVAPNRLAVGDEILLEAEAVVIATGSSPWIPPGLDAIAAYLDVNDDVFAWTDLPRRVAVLGTGVIGLELGQALHRLGVDVHLFAPDTTLGGLQDPEVHARALAHFGEALHLHLRYRLVEAAPTPEGARLTWEEDGARREGVFDRVLVAAGRRPNTTGLGLETLGVALGRGGVPEHDPRTMQVGDLPVFLAGDVTGERAILHEASDEGRIAGANAAAWPAVGAGMRRVPMGIVFSEPNLASVGLRFPELPEDCVAIGEVSFDDQGRSRVMGLNAGLARLYGDARTQRLIGAELMAPRGEHLAHLLAWAIQADLTVPQLLAMPFYHPVVEEGLRTGLRSLAEAMRVVSRCAPEHCADAPAE